MLKNLKGERIKKVSIDSCFGWVVNQEGFDMVSTDRIVCSLIVGASES